MKYIRWYKPTILEGPGETFTQGKAATYPPLVVTLAIAIIIVNFHFIGWFALAFVALYAVLHQIQGVFLHYAGHGNKWLSLPMTFFAWLMVVMLGLTFFALITVEAVYALKVRSDAKALAEYQAKDRRYQVEIADYNAWVMERQERQDQDEEKKARLADKLAALLQADKERATRLAIQYEKARELSRETGEKIRVPDAAPLLDSAKMDKLLETKADVIRHEPVKPVEPIPVAEDFLADWQFRIKIGQFIEFFVSLLGLAWLPVASFFINRQFRQQTLSEEERKRAEFVVAGAVPAEGKSGISLPDPVPIGVSPVLSDDRFAGAQNAQFSPTEAGESGTLPRGGLEPAVNPPQSSPTLPEPSPRIEEKKGTFDICNGEYRLKRKSGGGYDLRYASPADPKLRDICYVGEKDGAAILAAEPEQQIALVRALLVKKGEVRPNLKVVN